MNISLKRRNLSRNVATGEGAVAGIVDPGFSFGLSLHGAKKIARKPVSNRRMSH
jgi:hypothetical protein